jgi:hypothetical protein
VSKQNKQMGVIRYWRPDRGFGFVRDVTIDRDGLPQPTHDDRYRDHFLHAVVLEKCGIAKEKIYMGKLIKYEIAKSLKFDDRTECQAVELV